MKRDKSIIQKDMSKCYVCGTTTDLHTHEIFFGTADRKKSIEWGCYVRLCAKHHNMSNAGVHLCHWLDRKLKEIAQKEFESLYGHDKFMEIFHRNYL
ncbi:MAG: hypothetical protein Q4C64_08190 [Erysipelotrichia bacterium]|nr:hypothetical protein [Erysipelotrichia bacterium]